MIHTTSWPYANETGITEKLSCDVLVLGGGLAGCYAAIAAARRGQSVILVEKGAVERSGSAGTGFDHWESACTNPCSGVTPEEIAWAYVNEQDYYSNGIAHYIECREGYDRMLDMESFGGKIRDTKNEFEGAAFRDEKTKLMFAYDYKNKFTLRVWGSTFKPSLYKELKRLGVKLLEHTEATALLTSFVNGKNTVPEPALWMCIPANFIFCAQNQLFLLCPVLPEYGCLTQINLVCANFVRSRASEAVMQWAGEAELNLR